MSFPVVFMQNIFFLYLASHYYYWPFYIKSVVYSVLSISKLAFISLKSILPDTNESMRQSTLFILSLAIIQLSYACYITNCPIGGKRSLFASSILHDHQCPRCGANGQCYGSSICCTSSGCRIGHRSDIRQCSIEDHSVIPCTIKSASCSVLPNGQCAANGVCCNTESCQMDETCSMSSNQNDDSLQEQSHVL
ncbi:unnamed protein product [Rotaria socialis]|uniref:Uncharacterized protein n=1 Tax=Rotaria socialis TaxID=392032 RepID=A0A818L9S7_9BILA|nr:unnamed protein product [Rotaria socialis]